MLLCNVEFLSIRSLTRKTAAALVESQQTFTCSKSTLETLEVRKIHQRRQRRRSVVFIVNFEHFP